MTTFVFSNLLIDKYRIYRISIVALLEIYGQCLFNILMNKRFYRDGEEELKWNLLMSQYYETRRYNTLFLHASQHVNI